MTFSAAVALTTFAIVFPAELPDKTAIAALILGSRYRPLWASGRAYISAMTTAASAQDICGLGLYGENVWGLSGGYTWFARDVPMLMVTSVGDLAIASPT